MAIDYARNRKIKADRVYKTLGRMSVTRVVAGILVLMYVFVLAGTVSEFFIQKKNYKAADAFRVKAWTEHYKPEEDALITAGLAYYEKQEPDSAYLILKDLDISEMPRRITDDYKTLCLDLAQEYESLGDSEKAAVMRNAADRAVLEDVQ